MPSPDPEARRAQARRRYAVKGDDLRAASRAYYHAHREGLRASKAAYYARTRERHLARQAAAHRANPSIRHERELIRKRGMTLVDYDALLFSQGGGCAICGRRNVGARRFPVDHDHRTGTRRGILCNRCNGRLGSYADSIEAMRLVVAATEWAPLADWLELAIAYLECHRAD